jgi:hypothetical protein
LNIENKIGQSQCAWKEVFRALANALGLQQVWARPLCRCVSAAEHNGQKPRLAGEIRLTLGAAVRNCFMLAGKGYRKSRKFCPPCAVEDSHPFAAQRSDFGAGFSSCGAGWRLKLLARASGLE